MREANKDKKMTELSAIMAKEWKALGDEEKQVLNLCVCLRNSSPTTFLTYT